jgi:hypothetical protein
MDRHDNKGHENSTTEIVIKNYGGTIELLDRKPADTAQPAAEMQAPSMKPVPTNLRTRSAVRLLPC